MRFRNFVSVVRVLCWQSSLPQSSFAQSSFALTLWLGLWLVLAVQPSANSTASDDLNPPTRNERYVAKVVLKKMEEEHLASRSFDAEMTNRTFDQFVKMLDPAKVYFMQSDIDEFSRLKDQMADQARDGDYTFPLTVFKRFVERIDQRTALAIELVNAEHDFTIDEEIITDSKLIQFPVTEEEARDRWRKRIKYNLLVERGDAQDEVAKEESKRKKSKFSPEETLQNRFRGFARRMKQLNTEDVVEMYVTALTTSYDPHTTYMSAGSFKNFLIQMGLQLEGIGATLQATDEGYTVIKAIVPGGAADTQGGLKVEDRIIAVGQGDDNGQRFDQDLAKKNGLDFVDAIGMKLDEVVGMIRGKAGTVVRLQVMSENATEMHVVTIVREKIKLEDSAAQGQIFEAGQKPDGSPLRVGVIDLPSFYADMGEGGFDSRSTTSDVRKIINQFKKDGVDAVVLDLRRNGGGSLREAIDCTGLFIDTGTVVQVKSPLGRVERLNDESRGMAWGGPLVVLTSKFSASASEILAGAIKDYQRGIVIGDSTTHGKGTVQTLVNLDRGIYLSSRPDDNKLGALKITIQQFYRPNGESTQKRGVPSDIVLPAITEHMDVGESDLDFAIEFDTIPAAPFKVYEMANSYMLQKLAAQSSQRVLEDPEFQKLNTKIEHYLEQKQLKRVSLNEVTFRSRREKLKSEKEEEDVIESQVNPRREIERTFYLEEVFRITEDYYRMLQG
jgi:carboxyl-terminal processing protease